MSANDRLADLLEKAGQLNKEVFKKTGYWNFRYLEKSLALTEEEKNKYIDFYKSISNGEEPADYLLEDDIEYELREVYYNDSGEIIAWSEGITQIWCENRKDLKELFKKAKKASYKNTVILEDGKMRDSGRKMRKTWKK